jgi:arabinan endo-1,5-alpha-L-arabinosidase
MFGDGQGINASYSPDLRNWSAAAPVFPGNPPAWTTNAVPGFTGYFWAPDIIYLNGQYYLYYAASQWGTITSAIGLVTTPSLSAPVWTDQGSVIQYQSGVSYNCIDPSMLLDTNNGTLWLSFGSYSDGIFVTQLDPVTGKRITPNSTLTKVADTSTSFFSNTSEGSYLCQRGAYYYLFVNWGGCCSGISSTYNIRVGRSASVTGPYLDRNGVSMLTGGGSLFLESTGRFIGPGHAAVLNENGTNWFTYHYYDGNNSGSATFTIGLLNWSADGWPVFTNDWSAFYPFNVDAREHLGLYNGAMQNGAAITNEPGVGNVLALNGVSQYALLPDPVANASTFCAWVKWNGGQNWQRIFDFGDSTGSYLFLTPSANNGVMRFAITTSGNNNEQRIDAPAALPTNSWCHVAVTLDGSTGLLYLNGLPVATNSALTIRPWQTLARSNYVGKSQFPGDPGYNGEISSLRIFGRALGPGEIRDMAYANPKLAHRYSFTNAGWDSIGMAHGSIQGTAMATNHVLTLNGVSGGYMDLPGGLISGSAAATIEFWAAFGTNGTPCEILDFGNMTNASGLDYLYFSPHTTAGTHRLQLATNTTAAMDVPGNYDNLTLHFVCLIDPSNHYTAIYTNGMPESSSTIVFPPLGSIGNSWSFIGRSLFSSEAWLNAAIQEVRIYDGRLTPQEIAVNDRYGPTVLALPVSLSVSNAQSGLKFSWPSWAEGFALQYTTNIATGVWQPVTPPAALGSNQWAQSLPQPVATTFYRLKR